MKNKEQTCNAPVIGDPDLKYVVYQGPDQKYRVRFLGDLRQKLSSVDICSSSAEFADFLAGISVRMLDKQAKLEAEREERKNRNTLQKSLFPEVA